MSNPSDWLSQPYQPDFFTIAQTEPPPTKTTAGASSSSRSRFSLSPDRGRVGKPIRRMSRASRRTPTTMFNTDTTNFRAMVQRFTGFPTAAYVSGCQLPNGGGLNFTEHNVSAAAHAGGGTRPASGLQAEYPSQELRQQQMMFMMGGEGPSLGSASENENRSYDNYVL